MRRFGKKLVATAAAATMVLGLAACGGSGSGSGSSGGGATEAAGGATEAAAPASGGSDKVIEVGIINNDPNESGYRTANDKDLKAMFGDGNSTTNGYHAQYAYSLKNDEQIAAAQKFIQDGVDYLLLSAADTSGWDGVLKDAQAAGVQVILFDRTIDADASLYAASIVSDMDKEGEQAANWLKDQNLSEYNIIHLQGVMGSAAQQGRSGALDTLAKENGWNIVTQQTAEWNAEKAQQIVQSVIDAGTSFNVIYAENDDMAKGAVAALDKANISHGVGKDVVVIGFDCNKWALEELLNKNWNYDGQCNPFQAKYIDEVIKTLESGGTPAEKTIIMEEKGFDANTITQEDVDNYGI
jgi:simple sugar transport system substrate-binding protein